MDVRTQVREFIKTNFYLPDSETFADETSLFDSGVIDSTGVLEIIGFLETTFDTKLSDDELVPENLDSIARIVAFVERKRLQAA